MQVELALKLCGTDDPSQACLVQGSDTKLTFKCRQDLVQAGFPVKECSFEFERTYRPADTPQALYGDLMSSLPTAFMTQRTNAVVYVYGEQQTPKRQFLFGKKDQLSGVLNVESGWAQRILKEIFEIGLGGAVLQIQACALGDNNAVKDLLNVDNTACHFEESLDIVVIANLSTVTMVDYNAAVQALQQAVTVVEQMATNVKKPMVPETSAEDQQAEKECDCPCVPYDPSHYLMIIRKFESSKAVEEGIPQNMIYLLACGDCERPVLCGVHLNQMERYNGVHKAHSAIVTMLGAIRANRLRVPYNKSPLTSLLKGAYNQDKGNPYVKDNSPTKSYMIIFAFADNSHAEESYHTLIAGKRISTVTGGGGIGPVSRDVEAEKWRLEQDTLDLKDELQIAKVLYDYKPCIYGVPKPVENIEKEEAKRMAAISKKKEEIKAKEAARLQAESEQKVNELLQKEEQEYATKVQELQQRLAKYAEVTAQLSNGQEQRMKGSHKELEKTQRKKEEEYQECQKLKQEVHGLEEHLARSDMLSRLATARLEYLSAHVAETQKLWENKALSMEERQALVEKRRAERQSALAQLSIKGEVAPDRTVSQSIADHLKQYEVLLQQNAEKQKKADEERLLALQAAQAEFNARAKERKGG